MQTLNVNQRNVGCFINIPSPGLIEMAALAGFDMILLDMEHGPFTWLDLENCIRACESASTPSIVRVPERRREYILKALDSGASAIQIPMIETREDVEEVVSLAKYAPIGRRGVSFGQRKARYGAIPDKQMYLENTNETTKIVIQIETLSAVENIDEILTVAEVDVIFIGPTDLAVTMGYAHDLQNENVKQVIQTVKDKALAAGKVVGILGSSPNSLKEYEDMNINYLLTSIQPVIHSAVQEYKTSKSLL